MAISAQVCPHSESVNKGNQHTVSNTYVSGVYDETTGSLDMTFKRDTDKLDIIIYKDGKICKYETIENVMKNEAQIYQLSEHGSGVYTVCTATNRVIRIAGVIVVEE
ncbi:MAG TPA: hypothetical protein DEQ27_01475 [Prevotella sp.]|nr:hypothetical protein [Prevotella sp.]